MLKTKGPAHSQHCNRHVSRITRDLIQEDILPLVSSHYEDMLKRKKNNKPKEEQQHDGGNGVLRQKRGPKIDDDDAGVGEVIDMNDKWGIFSRMLMMSESRNHNIENKNNKNKKCLLDPKHDLFHHHDSHSEISHSRRNFYAGDLHVCKLCGKQFQSRYYLDKHLDLRHSHEFQENTKQSKNNASLEESKEEIYDESESGSNDMICLADSVCPILTGGKRACHEYVQKNGGYYGPGSATSNNHNNLLSSWFHYESLSCHEEDIKEYRKLCFSMFDDCFGSSSSFSEEEKETEQVKNKDYDNEADDMMLEKLLSDLKENICGKLTCKGQLHILADHHPTNDKKHLERKIEWDKHHNHSLGISGVLLILFIVIFYLSATVFGCFGPMNSSDRSRVIRYGSMVFGKRKKKRKTL